ncbi:MAG: hypothetical protein Q9190_003344 [Brigantiaea leucoxantha]
MATPRSEGAQISPNTPPLFVKGAEPKKPAKNLVMMTVWMSLAVAVPKENTAERKYGSSVADFRPNHSEQGAQSSGPTPSPTSRRMGEMPPASRLPSGQALKSGDSVCWRQGSCGLGFLKGGGKGDAAASSVFRGRID